MIVESQKFFNGTYFNMNNIIENSFIVPSGHLRRLVYKLTSYGDILVFLDNYKSKTQ